jgi:hypothetical protein
MYETKDHINLNFNNNISTAAVFLDIKKPLILYGTPAYYTNYLNWILNLLVHFFLQENSEFW